ncbi:hypothetical protein MLD38_021085 [Melastoma candidum]|uniref:Uncharacterized protein n=1 Tax=Melastoma candidum TaxID=119954 RepID=A0ACB9QF28_9MYRT|nr:hypothetical protein MLD38_021085 [Melastoma candidum]
MASIAPLTAHLSADACRSCLGNSGAQIKQLRSSEKQAVLFNENCTVMYSNTYIYGKVATSPLFPLYNPTNASNPTKHVQEF